MEPDLNWFGVLAHHATRAPHKPLLLLALMDLVEAGQLPLPVVPLSPELT